MWARVQELKCLIDSTTAMYVSKHSFKQPKNRLQTISLRKVNMENVHNTI